MQVTKINQSKITIKIIRNEKCPKDYDLEKDQKTILHNPDKNTYS